LESDQEKVVDDIIKKFDEQDKFGISVLDEVKAQVLGKYIDSKEKLSRIQLVIRKLDAPGGSDANQSSEVKSEARKIDK
jgi:hypothetical protein